MSFVNVFGAGGFGEVDDSSMEVFDPFVPCKYFSDELWKRLAKIDEHFFGNKEVLLGTDMPKLGRENVCALLEKLALSKYADLANVDDEEDILNSHNLLVYFNNEKELLWTLCPVKMALLLKEYQLAERLIDNGYSVAEKKMYFEYIDTCSAFTIAFGYGVNENKGIRHMNRSMMNRVDIIDFLGSLADIPDSLAIKIMGQCSEQDFLNLNKGDEDLIIERMTRNDYMGPFDVDRLLYLYGLENGRFLHEVLLEFATSIEIDSWARKIVKDVFNITDEDKREIKRVVQAAINTRITLLNVALEKYEEDEETAFPFALLHYEMDLIETNNPFGNPFDSILDIEMKIAYINVITQMRKSLLQLCANNKKLYDICYVETIKHRASFEFFANNYSGSLPKNFIKQGSFTRLLEKYDRYLISMKKDYMKSSSFMTVIRDSFTDSRLNHNDYIYFEREKRKKLTQYDLLCLSLVIRNTLCDYRITVSAKTLNFINRFIKRILQVNFTADELKECVEKKDEYAINNARLDVNNLLDGFMGIMSIFEYEYGRAPESKTGRLEIERLLKVACSMDSFDLIRFVFELGILPINEISQAKKLAIENDNFKILPILVGLEACG